MLVRWVVALVAFASALAVLPGPAVATPPVRCPLRAGPCRVNAGKPGTPSHRAPGHQDESGASRSRCHNGDKAVACRDRVFGVWDPKTECYVKPSSPQPPKSDPTWQGHKTGVIVDITCPGVSGTGGGWEWRPSLPGGSSISPQQLAERAVRQLPIHGPDIGMAPRPGSTGLVGLPVWMWTRKSPQTWGPASRTASVPGLSVTATAHGSRITWVMGDGHRVVCHGPGTPYRQRYGDQMSPTCGYRYTRSSAHMPGAVFRVTATTTWQVHWAGGGESGSLTVHRSSSTTVRIGEMQVLVQPD